MIDQQVVDMIDNPDPQVRADAVKKLARAGTQEAVQYLAAIYKTDSDPEVRELARKAGLYIKKKMTEEKWTGGDGVEDDEPDDVVQEIEVSPRAVESSKGLMDSAMNLHVAGDDDKAVEYIEKAFLQNPNLQNDPYYLQLAATVLGVKGDEVAEILLGDVEYGRGGKAKRKRKPREDDVSTEAVVIDLVIYFVVIATLVAVGMLLLISVLNGIFQEGIQSGEFAAAMSEEGFEPIDSEMVMSVLSGFLQGGIVISVITGVITGIYSVIAWVMQLACMHFIATSMLGGDGTFKQLIHKTTGFFTVFTVAYTIMSFLLIYVYVNGMLVEDLSTAMGPVSAMMCVLSIGSLGYLFWFISALSKVYEYGKGSGCGTFILGSIMFSFISSIISSGIFAVLSQSLFSMVEVSSF